MKNVFTEKLEMVFLFNGITLSDEEAANFERYYNELIEYNKNVNLTSITGEDEVIKKHFADSLLPLSGGLIPIGSKCIDVGTGAGFPGLPLAIMRRDINMTLMDSLKKRLVFLDLICKDLSLDNCRTLHFRAEDFAKTEYRESFDIAVTRAVSRLSSLSELCLPLVKVGGCVLAYKSLSVHEELREAEYAISLLGGKVEKVYGSDERNIVVIKKISPTPKIYPRKAGTPSKFPLTR